MKNAGRGKYVLWKAVYLRWPWLKDKTLRLKTSISLGVSDILSLYLLVVRGGSNFESGKLLYYFDASSDSWHAGAALQSNDYLSE